MWRKCKSFELMKMPQTRGMLWTMLALLYSGVLLYRLENPINETIKWHQRMQQLTTFPFHWLSNVNRSLILVSQMICHTFPLSLPLRLYHSVILKCSWKFQNLKVKSKGHKHLIIFQTKLANTQLKLEQMEFEYFFLNFKYSFIN